MKSDRLIGILLAFVVCYAYVEAGETSFVQNSRTKLKILAVFGHPGKSHFDFFEPLLLELARRGHDLTVISYFPRSSASKLKEPLPNYKDISLVDPNTGVFVNVVDLSKIDHRPLNWLIHEAWSLKYMADYSCNNALKNSDFRKFLRSGEKFDLVVTESFNTDCFLGILHRFKAPYITSSSHQIMPWASKRMGDPEEFSYVPIIFLGLRRPLDFLKRLENVVASAVLTAIYEWCYRSSIQALAEETFGPDLPDLRELGMNASALFLNTHVSLHGSRPHLQNIVELGGLHIPQKTSPLPSDIAKFLDDGREGVLYFNLGSMIKASSLPKEKLDVIIKVLASIPRKVIWKWESDQLVNQPKNLLVRKWLPQFDILNHPNVKCYFGHGGLLGLSEGVYAGTPMILMPMYGDQFHNAATAADKGVAVILQFKSLSEETLRSALDEVFNNTRYAENAKKLSLAYRDRPASPLETAVWWTEYIGRGNAVPYLRNDGARLPWYQRHLVDVALFLILTLLSFLYVVYRLIKSVLSLLGIFKGSKAAVDKRKSKKKD